MLSETSDEFYLFTGYQGVKKRVWEESRKTWLSSKDGGVSVECIFSPNALPRLRSILEGNQLTNGVLF